MRKAEFGSSDLHRAFAAWDFDGVEIAAGKLQACSWEIDALQKKLSNLKFDEGQAREKFDAVLRAAQLAGLGDG